MKKIETNLCVNYKVSCSIVDLTVFFKVYSFYEYACVQVRTLCTCKCPQRSEEAIISPAVAVQVVESHTTLVLGTKFKSSRRTENALNI